jgi:outer membrane protein TolC
MGRPLGADDALPVPEGELRFQPADFNVASETAAALKRRPDLRLLRETMRALQLEKRGLQARYLPVVGVTASERGVPQEKAPIGSVAPTGTSSSGSFIANRVITSEYEFVAAFTWQVIDNGEISGAVKRQQKAYEIDQVLLDKFEKDVTRDLTRIRQDLRSIEAKRKLHSAILVDAEKSVEMVSAMIAAGTATQLEYRIAQRNLIQVKVGILVTALLQSLSIAQWDQAAGRYLQFSFQGEAR